MRIAFQEGGDGWETVVLDGKIIGHLVFSRLYDPICQFKPLTSTHDFCLRLGIMKYFYYAIETPSLESGREMVKKILRRG